MLARPARPGQRSASTLGGRKRTGLAVAKGKLYVADTNNHLLRTIDLSSGAVSTLTITGLTAPAAAEFVIHFNNKESGVPHNVEIKDASGADAFKGEIITGPAEANYVVPSLKKPSPLRSSLISWV